MSIFRNTLRVVLAAAALIARADDPQGSGGASPPRSAGTTTTVAPEPGSAAERLTGLVVRSDDPEAPYDRDAMDGGDWAYEALRGGRVLSGHGDKRSGPSPTGALTARASRALSHGGPSVATCSSSL